MNLVIFNVVRWIIATFVVITLAKNYFFLIISPFYPLREKHRYAKSTRKRKREKLPPYHPKVSVIIPAWNEEVGVLKTLTSVIHNGYDNLEIVLINDGSTDNSDKVIKDFLKEHKLDKKSSPAVVYTYQDNAGKGTALNTGVDQATGDIILTVDADSALAKGAIANLTKYYLDDTIMAVVGNVEVINASTIIGFAQQLEYYFGFYNKRAHSLLGAEYIFGGACASFRKTVFDTIGKFDTSNKTEDIEMSMRTKLYGLKSTYAEDVVCFTEGASDLKGLIAQRIRWKKGRLDTFAKYRALFFSTEDHHNAFLSFFVLPFSLLSEIQLLFEPVAIAILIAYSVVTSEYLSLAIGMSFIFLVYLAIPLFHGHHRRLGLILLFPFTWPLFYFMDWVEYISLYQSLKMIRQGKDVEWQKWNRQGIHKLIKEGKQP